MVLLTSIGWGDRAVLRYWSMSRTTFGQLERSKPRYPVAGGGHRPYGEEVTEVPDADKAEQSIPADPDDYEPAGPVTAPDDAPEADVVEQSIPVPIDEDYR